MCAWRAQPATRRRGAARLRRPAIGRPARAGRLVGHSGGGVGRPGRPRGAGSGACRAGPRVTLAGWRARRPGSALDLAAWRACRPDRHAFGAADMPSGPRGAAFRSGRHAFGDGGQAFRSGRQGLRDAGDGLPERPTRPPGRKGWPSGAADWVPEGGGVHLRARPPRPYIITRGCGAGSVAWAVRSTTCRGIGGESFPLPRRSLWIGEDDPCLRLFENGVVSARELYDS